MTYEQAVLMLVAFAMLLAIGGWIADRWDARVQRAREDLMRGDEPRRGRRG